MADPVVISPIIGTSEEDVLRGGNASEIFSGRAGDDTITANSGYDLAYGGIGNDTISGGTGNDVLYGGGGPSLIDMTGLSIAEDYSGTVTFLNEGAGFRNTLGMYKVSEDGTIQSIEVLFPNASAQGSGGSLIRGVSSAEVNLSAGDTIGFFVVPNGYRFSPDLLLDEGRYVVRTADGALAKVTETAPTTLYLVDATSGAETPVISQYGTAVFHSAADPSNGYALNADSFPHTVGHVDAQTGTITLGFEDLYNGGDRDYDDVVFLFDVGQSNARVLDPNLQQQPLASDVAWYYGEDGGRYTVDGIRLADENDTIDGGTGDDEVYGMAGHDVLFGGDGHDFLKGNSGDDRMNGGSGNDEMSGGLGNDIMNGDSGHDELTGNSGDDLMSGGTGDDVLRGANGNDVLHGGSGADYLEGGSDHDELYGDSGNDVLDGGSGSDELSGGTGNDTLNGGTGSDTINGSSGNDTANGGDGNDRIEGGTGNDVLNGDAGHDTINGGSGDDSIDGGANNDRIDAGSGNDIVKGGSGKDNIKAGSGNDLVEAGEGDDYVSGYKGNDVIDGGDGNDKLSLGAGDDIASGGAGNDRFIYRSQDLDGGEDIILDFRNDGEESDVFDFSALGLLDGTSAEAWIGANVTKVAGYGVEIDLGGCTVSVENTYADEDQFFDDVSDALVFA